MPNYEHATNRREAYAAWLTANNINPNLVLLDADVYIDTAPDGTHHIVYEACHLTPDGHRQVNERGDGVAVERRTTPLLVEPPDWWEPYRKPTREQFLNVLEHVKALVDEKGEQNRYIARERLRAVLDLAYEGEGL